MIDLKKIGYTKKIARRAEGLEPGRVASADRGKYVVLAESSEVLASAAGKLLHSARGAVDLPAVGDWVGFRREGDRGVIERVLPRSSCLIRKSAGRDYEAQVICANLDKIFIVTAVGRDLNVNRVLRYLAACFSAGAEPVVVVNKKDLDHDRQGVMAALDEASLAAPIIMSHTKNDDGLDELRPHIADRETVALVGSSGVGKSSIVNRLIGDERQSTLKVREADGKGRHSTTRRELIVADGFVIVDTPGMREFGLWDADAGLDEVYAEIVEFTAHCKYRDCSHVSEPGCAVVDAVESGLLPRSRLEGYLRLRAELDNAAKRAEVRDGKETKRRWKRISKDSRKRKKIHGNLGLK